MKFVSHKTSSTERTQALGELVQQELGDPKDRAALVDVQHSSLWLLRSNKPAQQQNTFHIQPSFHASIYCETS